ncbi:MAG: hypothetical protein KDD11_08805 [Acidobacteria bacterium]|nr:hypothetical protein [Acidobacteriota bacterium]
MARVSTPERFSDVFEVSPEALKAAGCLDPTLAVDSKLFIDPLLFEASNQAEFSETAAKAYREHFERVIKLLASSRREEDVAWRSARRQLTFHEISGTCLGYGASSISGSGFGTSLTNLVVSVGKQIVDLGVTDPDLFAAMALFEGGIGADRLSDMATNVVWPALVDFNERVLRDLGLKGEHFYIRGKEGKFVRNPLQERRTPVILVARDVLRALPIAADWDDIADAALESDQIRDRVNRHIAHIWAAKTNRDKTELRNEALASREAFEVLLAAIHAVPTDAYDLDSDPDGYLAWSQAINISKRYPLNLSKPQRLSPEAAEQVVTEIVAQFRHLIEERGLNRELYRGDGSPRHESTAQRLFFAVSYSYCKANDLDVSPELDTGNGRIDFKFSQGFECRVLVEIKLSSNPKVVAGYERQLESYKAAEETARALYVLIDVGKMGTKLEKLFQVRNTRREDGSRLSAIEVIDALVRATASKR